MDKLEMALELIRRAQHERERLNSLEKELDKVGFNWQERYKVMSRYSPLPSKAIINDSLKMARRLILEEYV